jgi:tRNA 2-thiouridine synthesizing protein E
MPNSSNGLLNPHSIAFDEHGFLENPALWTRDLALGIAAELKLGELSEDHWRVVDQLRAHYLESGRLPGQQTLCRELGLDDDCIVELFDGPLSAWQIAGLPDPGDEARTHMEALELRGVPGGTAD